MALITPGALVGQISGRIGGTIFSHNQGGNYVRNGTIPSNPQTAAQTEIRAITASNAAAWQALATAGKDSWNSWAESNAGAEYVNRLGLINALSGQQAYVRINNRLAYAGQVPITAPPSGAEPVAVTAFSMTYENDAPNITITFPTLAPAVPGASEVVQIAMTQPMAPGRTRYQTNALRLVYTSAVNTAAVPADLATAYTARYGYAPVASLIGAAARTLDVGTGMITPWVHTDLFAVTAPP